MLSALASKTSESVRSGAKTLASAAPRYEKPPTWLPGLRVLLAFYAPMLLGLAIGRPGLLVPVGIGAGMLALVDPMGSTVRRSITIGATTLASAAVFAVGAGVGQIAPLTIAFVFVVVYIAGLSVELGGAGLRAGLWIVTAAIFGISNTGITPGYFSATGMLLGGLWALFLAAVPFRNEERPLSRILSREAIRAMAAPRLQGLIASLPDHLKLRTALGRQALRMSSAAALALSVSYLLERPTIGWIAGATIAVLNPQVRLFRARSTSLFIGTALGAGVAFVLAMLTSNITLMLALVAPVIFLAANLRTVDYGAWITLYSTFNLVMLFVTTGNGSDVSMISNKLLDTVIGAAIALLVAWTTFPYSERERLDEEFTADLEPIDPIRGA